MSLRLNPLNSYTFALRSNHQNWMWNLNIWEKKKNKSCFFSSLISSTESLEDKDDSAFTFDIEPVACLWTFRSVPSRVILSNFFELSLTHPKKMVLFFIFWHFHFDVFVQKKRNEKKYSIDLQEANIDHPRSITWSFNIMHSIFVSLKRLMLIPGQVEKIKSMTCCWYRLRKVLEISS